jgi:epoxyqueuosine reductase
MKQMEITQIVKRMAHELGFQLVGITSNDPPAHMDVYSEWISNNRHAEMAYLETERAIERRRDPRKILPECKSILVLGINYRPEGNPNKSSKHGKVATYALGDDYHGLIESRLKELVLFIEVRIGNTFPYRIYSDTGPLLEREFAQRAGLGWIGKNTCLINPTRGSYFLIGEILLGIELDPDEPFMMDYCGSCTRCVESCPTACILPNRTIDSGRCISYLTIEKRGNIPEELRNTIDDWVFGCDVCQDVCPWNLRFARPTSVKAFHPRKFLNQPRLLKILNLSEASYKQKLHGSSLKRPKLNGLLRNAAVAAGNTKSPEYIRVLAKILTEHPDPIVRSHCAWALGQFKDPENVKILRDALESEDHSETRNEIVSALDFLQKN